MTAAQPASAETRPFEPEPAEEERIGRFVLQCASAPAITSTGALAGSGAVVIVDDETGVGEALADALAERGEPTLLTATEEPKSPEAAGRLAERVRAAHGGAKALVHLAALGHHTDDAGLSALLLLAQALRADLEAAAAAGGAVVLGATRLGGDFGLSGPPEGAASEGTVPGFLKTLAQEWPGVRVKAVDLSPTAPEEAATRLLDELLAGDGIIEVGYRSGERMRLSLAPVPLDERPEGEPLDADSVVLVTGGARGITAAVALTLAERYRPTLVLVGRTPRRRGPGRGDRRAHRAARPPSHVHRAAPKGRSAGDARARRGGLPAPCSAGARCATTSPGLQPTGANVEYLTCDVRDPGVFGAVIDGVYETSRPDRRRHPRRRGHRGPAHSRQGARVDAARAGHQGRFRADARSAAAARWPALRGLLRLGLRTLRQPRAGRLRRRERGAEQARPGARPPLAGPCRRDQLGTVAQRPAWSRPRSRASSPSRGVALIPVDTGCRLLDEELRRGRKGETEVVIGAAAPTPGPLLTAATRIERTAAGELDAIRRLRLDHDRYLDDHRVDGRPVLPFAVAMELMAEAAMAARAGAEVAGLRDIRLLHGITVDETHGTAVRVVARPTSSPDEIDVTIEMRGGPRPHYRALVQLRGGDRDTEPTDAAGPGSTVCTPFPMAVETAYRDLLFHGPLFQGIAEIDGMDERGAVSWLRPSSPEQCLAAADGSAWLLDPVLLDSALQVQVVWARLHWDVTLLPAEIRAHRRVHPSAAAIESGELVRHELHVRPDSERPLCHGRPRFHLPDGRLLATLEDVVGVGNRSAQPARGCGGMIRPGADGHSGGVAIIGMSCLFPGAPDVDAYWRNILGKVDARRTRRRRLGTRTSTTTPTSPDEDATYCKRGGYLGSLATFDPLAHGIPPVAVGGEPDQWLALQARPGRAGRRRRGRAAAARPASGPRIVLGKGTYLNGGNAIAVQRGLVVGQTLDADPAAAPGVLGRRARGAARGDAACAARRSDPRPSRA